jgi:hypothetical protein
MIANFPNKEFVPFDVIRAIRQYYLPQVEQLVAAQPLQEELAVLLNFPPLEKAKADIIRWTFLLLHLGQAIFSEVLNTNFSNSFSH